MNVRFLRYSDLRANVQALERTLIESALDAGGGNRSKAVALLGLSRYGLLKKLQRTGQPRRTRPSS